MKALSGMKRNIYDPNRPIVFEFVTSEDPACELHDEGLGLRTSVPSAHNPNIPHRGTAQCLSGSIEDLGRVRGRLLARDWTHMAEEDEVLPKSSYSLLVTAPLGSINAQQLNKDIVLRILDVYHPESYGEQPRCEDRSTPTLFHRLCTKLVDKDNSLERVVAELKKEYLFPTLFDLRPTWL
jgi:hypothetical protein